jgi:hypothetical protein
MTGMTLEQFNTLSSANYGVISVDDLVNKNPRTLVYGYSLDRDTTHVYLGSDGLIHRVDYSHGDILIAHVSAVSFDINDLRPSKRSYPERTDFEFAKLVAMRGGDLCFTSYTEGVEAANFYGYRAEELTNYSHISQAVTKLQTGCAYDGDAFRTYIYKLHAANRRLLNGQPLPVVFHSPGGDTTFDLVDIENMIVDVGTMELNEKAAPKRDDFIATAKALIVEFVKRDS